MSRRTGKLLFLFVRDHRGAIARSLGCSWKAGERGREKTPRHTAVSLSRPEATRSDVSSVLCEPLFIYLFIFRPNLFPPVFTERLANSSREETRDSCLPVSTFFFLFCFYSRAFFPRSSSCGSSREVRPAEVEAKGCVKGASGSAQ